jgi:predicted TIM-barrel fold metal-dependent hydrolase
MVQHSYAIDPEFFGLPTREELAELRIWDLHYHGTDVQERMMEYVERLGVERVISLDIAGSVGDDLEDPEMADRHRQMLETYRDRMAGIVRIDPSQVDATLERIDRWVREGPAIGIKYQGRNYQEPVNCAHPNNDPIIEAAAELGAVVYIHTWLKTGGDPRRVGGGNFPGESSPIDVAELASRFPDVPLICGHSGGTWELAARAIRPHENVFFEYAGSPPWSGMVDYGVDWLGVDRLVWGGHGPSRSYSNEMSKVLDSDLDSSGKKKVFGENLRRIAAPIMREKGYDVEV